MKDQNLNDKFPKRNNFVKPLYKRIDRDSAPTNENLAAFRSKTTKVGKFENEDGIDRNVKIYKRNFRVDDGGIIKRDESYYISGATLPGVCGSETRARKSPDEELGSHSIVDLSGNRKICDLNVKFPKDKCSDKLRDLKSKNIASFNEKKSIPGTKSMILKQYTIERWLRVLPAPSGVAGEPCHAALLRCVLCQLGLAAVLLLWTAAAATLLYYAEGPYETERVSNVTRQRKQLAVDLATELRQISVVSPAWLAAIERRLDEARRRTAGDASRARSAILWDPVGAVLFAVLVMSVLGFGAPMPQTTLGRMTALIYALLAVPMHFYMVTNASIAFMSLMECHLTRYRSRLRNTSGTLIWILNLICSVWGILLALSAYYALGVVSFGVGRGENYLDAVMFPLQFTAGGGLEQMSAVVRACYAAYVEGGALLAACAWRAARARAARTLAPLADEYELFSCTDAALTT